MGQLKPGARTHWHRHPLGRTVFVTDGVGPCRRRGGPIEVLRPGNRVLFEADEEHWHGAAPNRLMVTSPSTRATPITTSCTG
ncbi:cupin domain-containing protein [Streptomyces sp. NPDC017673]|uniref:cupin domain-containing protein n=1 Tax=unclassified Streptomyces TaxID=2593676 RepID=UPI00378E0628